MKYGTFIEAKEEFAKQVFFLNKAISDDVERYFMWVLHIEKSEKKEDAFMGITTDGRRLHIVDPLAYPLDNLEEGDYRVFKSDTKTAWLAKQIPHKKDENDTYQGSFPKWRRVIPTGEATYTTIFVGFDPSMKSHIENTQKIVDFIREFPDPTILNFKYLADLGLAFQWEVNWWGADKAMTFTSGDHKAIIMPMRYEE